MGFCKRARKYGTNRRKVISQWSGSRSSFFLSFWRQVFWHCEFHLLSSNLNCIRQYLTKRYKKLFGQDCQGRKCVSKKEVKEAFDLMAFWRRKKPCIFFGRWILFYFIRWMVRHLKNFVKRKSTWRTWPRVAEPGCRLYVELKCGLGPNGYGSPIWQFLVGATHILLFFICSYLFGSALFIQ